MEQTKKARVRMEFSFFPGGALPREGANAFPAGRPPGTIAGDGEVCQQKERPFGGRSFL